MSHPPPCLQVSENNTGQPHGKATNFKLIYSSLCTVYTAPAFLSSTWSHLELICQLNAFQGIFFQSATIILLILVLPLYFCV